MTTEAHSTRRTLFAAGATIATVGLPAVALGLAAPGDAQFLEWEREANFWRAPPRNGPRSDEEIALIVERQHFFEELIATTPATSVVGARVKAAFLLASRSEMVDEESHDCERREMTAIRTLLATLQASVTT